MKSSNASIYIITGIVAVAGFILIRFFDIFESNIAFALGALITGVILSLLKTGASAEETSSAEELTTLYIGNLNYKVNENAIKTHFEKYGYVDSVRLMKDRKTGRRKGFGFVEVDINSADKMITKLNDSTFEERTLRVRLAKEKSED
jgi:RNA recognition motif-containing protein